MSEANKIQIGGTHYQRGGIQHWDFVVYHNVPYLLAVATKYLTRWRDKNGVEDLRKAAHYVVKASEIVEQCTPMGQPSRICRTFLDTWVRPSPFNVIRFCQQNNVSGKEAELMYLLFMLPTNRQEALESLQIASRMLEELIATQAG